MKARSGISRSGLMHRIFACLLAISFLHAADPVPLFIEGYAGQRSVAQGEDIPVHVSTTAAKFEIEVARLGAKREVMWKKSDVPGQAHPVPEDSSANGCRWPESVSVPAVSLTSEALAPLITPEKLPAPTVKVVALSWTSPAPDREATATVLPEKEA